MFLNDPRLAALAVIIVSVLSLLTAFFFQYVVGLDPCVLCIYQRYPYGVTILLGLAALVWGVRGNLKANGRLLALCGLVFLIGGGIALYHVGVEQGWISPTAACTGPTGRAGSVDELYNRLMADPIARCDVVPWALFGISMAGYNAVFSLALAAFAFTAARRAADSA
jgi:disulfide bond formation protein DsbB